MARNAMRVLGWLTVLMVAAATPALADSHEAHGKGHEKTAAAGKGGTGPSPESRAKMADAHEKMAACLRSTRPIDECHAEMKKACHESGHGECSMGHHGPHGAGHGHGPGHGPHDKPTDKSSTAPGAAQSGAPTTSDSTK